jgi:hypothetical protein
LRMRGMGSVGAAEDASQAADPGAPEARRPFAVRQIVTTRRSTAGAAPLSEDAFWSGFSPSKAALDKTLAVAYYAPDGSSNQPPGVCRRG